jgi:hypothetical protein
MLKREVKQTNPERSRQPLGGALLSSAVYGNGFTAMGFRWRLN